MRAYVVHMLIFRFFEYVYLIKSLNAFQGKNIDRDRDRERELNYSATANALPHSLFPCCIYMYICMTH